MEEEKRSPAFFATKRVWLNVLLFVVTAVSTFVVGFSWSIGYKYAELFSQNPDLVPDPGMVLKCTRNGGSRYIQFPGNVVDGDVVFSHGNHKVIKRVQSIAQFFNKYLF